VWIATPTRTGIDFARVWELSSLGPEAG